MANSYPCSCCAKDGSYCDCFRAETKCVACRLRGEIKRPYQTSPEDKLIKERLELRAEWRKLGVEPTFLKEAYPKETN